MGIGAAVLPSGVDEVSLPSGVAAADLDTKNAVIDRHTEMLVEALQGLIRTWRIVVKELRRCNDCGGSHWLAGR